MNEKNLSRRNFLAKGAALSAAPAILVVESYGSAGDANEPAVSEAVQDDRLTARGVQKVANKTISSSPAEGNILGTDHVNIREYRIAGTDITDALNEAIDSLKNAGRANDVSRGGSILIPRGRWTSRGGHDIYSSVTVEGVGSLHEPNHYNVPWGSEITFTPRGGAGPDYLFRIESQHNCGLKNVSIKLGANKVSGLLITNQLTNPGWMPNVRNVNVENVSFGGGLYGIRVFSKAKAGEPYAEFVPLRFERVSFTGCTNGFYSNSANSGFYFDTCLFSIPANGIALNCEAVGNMSVDHTLFLSSGGTKPALFADNKATVLRTVNAYNNISFNDCQDEGAEFTYINNGNYYEWVPIVYRNCLIQGKFQLVGNGSGSVVLDSCRVFGEVDTSRPLGIKAPFFDTRQAFYQAYLRGRTSFFGGAGGGAIANGTPTANFQHEYSQIFFDAVEAGHPHIMKPNESASASYRVNNSRGVVLIGQGSDKVTIHNNRVTDDTMVFTQLMTRDNGSAFIREVVCSNGQINIFLNKPAANKLRVGFKVELYST